MLILHEFLNAYDEFLQHDWLKAIRTGPKWDKNCSEFQQGEQRYD